MRRLRTQFAVIVSMLLFCPLLARAQERRQHDQSQEDQQIVDSFFPPDLVSSAVKQYDKLTCFERLDDRTIVAGYSYGFSSAILLLKEGGRDHYKKAFQISGPQLDGGLCHVDVLHLSEDRHALCEKQPNVQVAVGFATASINSLEWVFQVEDDKLINISPMTAHKYGPPLTELSSYNSLNNDLIDYYQDGTHQMVSEPGFLPADESAPKYGRELYRLVEGKLQLDTSVSVVWAEKIDRTSGSEPFGDDFPKPTSLFGPFVLHIANGDWHGEHRVKRATILLNGIVVASLGLMDGIVEFNVNLQEGNNKIEIRTGREDDEEMSVAIVQKTAQTTTTAP